MSLTASLAAASMLALAQPQPAAQAQTTGCEQTFRKSGNPLTGLRFNAERSVAELSLASAIGQLRGIVIAKGYTVMTAEPEAGTMLIEQPMTGKARGFPIEIAVTDTAGQGTVRMEARLRAAMGVKEAAARAEMCGILAQLKGGTEGLALARKGEAAKASAAAPIRMSALRFSSQMAGEARQSDVSLEPRYKGRAFTLHGPVAAVGKAGDSYRVDFKLVESVLSSIVPGSGYRLEVSCILAPGQSTYALSLRPDQHVELTGVFDEYAMGRSTIFLRDCVPVQ